MRCIRCEKDAEGISNVPHGGALGETLKAKICSLCWEEWNKESVKIINEHRLNLSELAARSFLSTQMKIFLKLAPSAPISVTLS
ncbi:MAG: Fe(2+)-trafficking protein [Nitrospirae bacterium]|nr:Fe(2+)-trafficking protein [Candidatus Troglogloeales bacterium]